MFSIGALALLLSALCHAGELADPTRPAGAKEQSTAGARPRVSVPVVSAIIVGDERRIAIVNGQAVKAGDRVAGVIIEAVLDNGVRYRRPSGTVAVSELPTVAARVRTDVSTQTRLGDSKQ